MVDHSVCPSKANVELADVVRQFGPQYIAQYGQGMMPSQKRALSDIAACCTKELGDGSTNATTAIRRFGVTTAAATGPAPNAMETRPANGSKTVRLNYCPATIFTLS